MFGHWFEILVLLGLALLVFGPKRMIEMGSQLGKTFRDLQGAVKEMNLSSLINTDEPSSTETISSKFSQLSQTIGERDRAAHTQPVATVESAPIVEATVERVEEHVE